MFMQTEVFRLFPSTVILALPMALLTTTCLFFLMYRLVYTEPVEFDAGPVVKFPDVVMDERTTDPIIEVEVPKPKPVEAQPEQPKPKFEPQGGIDFSNPTVKLTHIDGPIKLMGTGLGVPVAQYLVTAKYPPRALSRGVEGWVDIRFDVSAQGTTENVQVFASSPEGVFEKSALDAARRWRYQPLVDNEGLPKSFVGLTKRIRFEMQK